MVFRKIYPSHLMSLDIVQQTCRSQLGGASASTARTSFAFKLVLGHRKLLFESLGTYNDVSITCRYFSLHHVLGSPYLNPQINIASSLDGSSRTLYIIFHLDELQLFSAYKYRTQPSHSL
jgi:hypothetical protein